MSMPEAYIEESIATLYSFSESFGKISRRTIDEKIKTLEQSQKAFKDEEAVRKSIDDLVKDLEKGVSLIKNYADAMGYPEEEYTPFVEKVFNYINERLNHYAELTGNLYLDLALHEVIKETKDYVGNFVDEKNTLPLIIAPVIKKTLTEFLSCYQMNNEEKIVIKKIWNQYIISEYYSGSIDDEDSIQEIITNEIAPQAGEDWSKELLRRICLPENENLIVSNFNKWFHNNYKRLVVDFYKWKEHLKPQIPVLAGLINVSIQQYLSTPTGGIISKSKFENTANSIISLLNNEDIKNMVMRKHSQIYAIYEQNINAKLRHYFSSAPGAEMLKEFAGLVTAEFLNLFKAILSSRIDEYERNNGTFRERYSQWLKAIYNNIENKELGKDEEEPTGIRDDYWTNATIEEVNNLFKIEKMPVADKVKRTRRYYGRVERMVKEVIKRDDGEKFGYLDVYEPLMNRDREVELKTQKFIKEKWDEFQGMNADE